MVPLFRVSDGVLCIHPSEGIFCLTPTGLMESGVCFFLPCVNLLCVMLMIPEIIESWYFTELMELIALDFVASYS